jgi:type IV pilus assembly protein PilC
MLSFEYIALDKVTGKRVKAEVQAQDEKSAAKLLTEKGLSPLEITPVGEKHSLLDKVHRIPTKEKVIFSRQLSTLIDAGLPIVQSLRSVSGQTKNAKLKLIIEGIINDVEAGSSLADSMAKYPKVFSQVYISLIAAGEASGTLDASLERVSNQQEKDAEIVSKVRGAMIYPLIVILVMIAVVTFMLVTVLPQVQDLYEGLPGAKLPVFTRMLLAVSQFIIHYWWVVILIFAVMGVITTRWARTGPGRDVIDRLKMKMWPTGTLFMKLYMARFARTASTLVASGVPMLKMLTTTADAVNNVHVARSITVAAEKVKGGKSLSEALEDDKNFLELVPNMIHIGEQSGSLEGMLGKVADYYEKEVDNQIKSVSTIIEPVLMIFIGVSALIIVAAVLLPIYSLAGKNLVH